MFESHKNTAMHAFILCLAVCACDVMNKVTVCGTGVCYDTSLPLFFNGKEWTSMPAPRGTQIRSQISRSAAWKLMEQPHELTEPADVVFSHFLCFETKLHLCLGSPLNKLCSSYGGWGGGDFFLIWDLNPQPFNPESTVLSTKPCHLCTHAIYSSFFLSFLVSTLYI